MMGWSLPPPARTALPHHVSTQCENSSKRHTPAEMMGQAGAWNDLHSYPRKKYLSQLPNAGMSSETPLPKEPP